MITIGIAGGTGYTAGELLRILTLHPHVQIKFVHSTSQTGTPISAVHTDLTGDTDIIFSNEIVDVDVLFLCLGHGISAEFLNKNKISAHTRVIDLGSDFRTVPQHEERYFVYGLPEINRTAICNAHDIANPGCFATAMQLALLPLAVRGLLGGEVHINGITGSSGAGRTHSETTHFSYRSSNVSVYKPFVHQHLAEVQQTLRQHNGNKDFELCFVPIRGNFVRGIFMTIYMACTLSEDEIISLYSRFYEEQCFVHLVHRNISVKDVVGTNKCLLQVQKIGGRVFITAAIDNLVKGASGQAVQNMNLMCGLPEATGLRLRSLGL
jgi:N-acetyl-gamma-glutamyl-phosphate reductase